MRNLSFRARGAKFLEHGEAHLVGEHLDRDMNPGGNERLSSDRLSISEEPLEHLSLTGQPDGGVAVEMGVDVPESVDTAVLELPVPVSEATPKNWARP